MLAQRDQFWATAYHCIYESEMTGTQTVDRTISGTAYTLKASFFFGGYGVPMQGTGRTGSAGDYVHYVGGGGGWVHTNDSTEFTPEIVQRYADLGITDWSGFGNLALSHPENVSYSIVSGVTGASGRALEAWRSIAVDPAVISLGTVGILQMVTGTTPDGATNMAFRADDTGGAITGNRIDVYVGEGDSAIEEWNHTGGNRYVRLSSQRLDLVFCIDTTGSMWDDIDAVKVAATEIVDQVAANIPDSRIAVVDYRDFPVDPYGASEDYEYHDVQTFTNDKNVAVAAIQSLSLGNGLDWEESVYSALMHCIDSTSLGGWRGQPVKKMIILTGDAPPHDPEPFTGYTMADVIQAAEDADPVMAFPIVIGGDSTATSFFEGLAEGTGGEVFAAADADEVVDAIIEAIETITYSPFAEAGGPYEGTVGTPIAFDASGSYDPDGEIVLYEWDWDWDDVYDYSSDSPLAEHIWTGVFSGTVRMRVTDDEGLTSYDTAIVEVQGKPNVAIFDFGTSRSPVAPGYMRVAKSTQYTGARGFGWKDGRINDRDRGIGSSADRDLNFTRDGIFAFDVPDGKYEVTVTVGDKGPYHHDQMGIFLEGRLVESVSTGVGEVATRTYEVDVADGQLALGLRDLGGSDPNVCIEKLEVAQLEEGPDTTPPTFDIVDVTPDPRMTGVNQIGINFSEEVTGFDLSDLTLTRDGGPNLLTGTEPLTTPNNQHWTLDGLSELSNTPGTYAVTLDTASSGIADLAGNPLVAGATETFTVQEEQPFEAHYDFGTGSSPVAAGYTRVTETTQYSAAQQYGWQAGVIKSRDRRAGSLLEQDLNFATDGIFAVDVPNGRYLIDLVLGDKGPYWHDQMGVWLEDALVDTVSTPANKVVSRSYNVDVLDGQLTLLLRDRGGSDPNVCINAMDVALLELFGGGA